MSDIDSILAEITSFNFSANNKEFYEVAKNPIYSNYFIETVSCLEKKDEVKDSSLHSCLFKAHCPLELEKFVACAKQHPQEASIYCVRDYNDLANCMKTRFNDYLCFIGGIYK